MQSQIAKVFKNGRSQAVRLPKEFRFEDDEVLIRKKGNDVILSPLPKSWDTFFKETPLPSEDFMTTREDLPNQVREDMF
ncbi:MAG: type II toxin-antitoxin system VapB family antitoxin [Candidatus Aminicenantes bacterium]|jgi:antitoxin VapB